MGGKTGPRLDHFLLKSEKNKIFFSFGSKFFLGDLSDTYNIQNKIFMKLVTSGHFTGFEKKVFRQKM